MAEESFYRARCRTEIKPVVVKARHTHIFNFLVHPGMREDKEFLLCFAVLHFEQENEQEGRGRAGTFPLTECRRTAANRR